MNDSRIQLSNAKEDGQRLKLQAKAKKLKELLETKSYKTMEEFLVDGGVTVS